MQKPKPTPSRAKPAAVAASRSSARELNELAARMTAGSDVQTRSLDGAVTLADGLLVSLKNTARQAQSLAQSGEETASSVNEMAASIEQVTASGMQVAAAANQTSTAIKQIAAGTQSV